MISLIAQFIVSAAVIVAAGVFLTRSADRIAERTRLGRLLVGSLFLAAATSLPEFFVDLSAVLKNMPDLAVGDLLGSSLFNLLILAVADLMHRGSTRIFAPVSGAHALAASLSIVMTATVGISIFLGPRLGDYAVGEFGAGVWMIVIAYILGVRMVYNNQRSASGIQSRQGGDEPAPMTADGLSRAFAGYLVSALLILLAAPFLADAAGEIARRTGLGGTFIGTSLVAFCTSLPELVSTISAVRMGAIDLALGNIFGSNALNMVLLAPLDLAFPGALLASVSKAHVLTCLAVVLVTSVAVMGQLYQVEKRKKFIEPDAFAVIALVSCSLFMLYMFRNG